MNFDYSIPPHGRDFQLGYIAVHLFNWRHPFWALLETLFSPALNQMFPQPSPHRSVYRYYIWVYRQSVILGIPSCIVTLIQPALFFMSETHKVNHTLAPSGLWIANNSKRCQ